MTLPKAFSDRMKAQLGKDYAAYLAAMAEPPRRALRINTLKTCVEDFLLHMDGPLRPTGLLPESFYVPPDFQPARSLPHRAGHCYMQEPSAQLPVLALPIAESMAVLDLCAAPGGKASQIAAAQKGSGLLVANEPIPARARTLMGNLERLGVTNAIVTSMPPERLCPLLTGCFDAVLVDAPCSGEGMFRKDEGAIQDWSPAHVSACAVRQAAILEAAAIALRPGGTLVYATCTFSPEENEGVVDAFLRAHEDFTCDLQRHVYPHEGMGEGQFFARLRRADEAANGMPPATGQNIPAWEDFRAAYMPALSAQRPLLLPDGRVFLLPPLMQPAFERLHMLCAGVLAGEIKGARFLPAHALAMAFPQAFAQYTALSDDSLPAYLHGEAIPCDGTLSGWCAVRHGPLVLGLGKASGGMLKNHLPKGLRN